MARFMREHPAIGLTLEVANTEEIARQVANFEIDVGLVEGEVEHPDLEITPWRDDELVVFCGARHPLARKRALTDADLRGATWIVREHGSGTRQAFDRAMRGLLPELQHRADAAAHRGDQARGRGRPRARLRLAHRARGRVRARHPQTLSGPAPRLPPPVLLPAAQAEAAQRRQRGRTLARLLSRGVT